MCKTIETSLATFAISTICTTILAFGPSSSPQLKWAALFIFTFTVMQLADALLWWAINNKKNDVNRVVSSYVLVGILAAELLVSFYGAAYFMGHRNKAYEVILWIYVATLLWNWKHFCGQQNTAVGQSGYLRWCDNQMLGFQKILFLAFLLLPFIMAYPPGYDKALILAVTVGTFILNFKREEFASRWCWTSNILGVSLLPFAFA
jgi:hypothetical protein